MSYEKIDPKPAGCDPAEVAVLLDDGARAAVSVEVQRLENGGGVSFLGNARCIGEDGVSLTCGHGIPIHSSFSYSCDAATVALYSVPTLAKEVLLLLLGEPLTEVEKPGPEGEPPHNEAIINWGPDVTLNASIRHAMICADEAAASSSADDLLFP